MKVDHSVPRNFESRAYATNALTWLLLIAGVIAVLDAGASTDRPVHAIITFIVGVVELSLAFYVHKTARVSTSLLIAAIASGIVYLSDFACHGDAYYFAIGFSVPIGAALFVRTRHACATLITYLVSGIVIAYLLKHNVIRPIYEPAGLVLKTATAIILMSLTTSVTMWKERLLATSQKSEWQQRVRLNIICDTACGAFFETDTQGTITFARGPLINEMGYAPEELLGRNQFDFLTSQDRRQLSQQPPTNEKIQHDREIRILDAYGRERWVRLSSGSNVDATGQQQWIHAIQDIHEVVSDRQQVFESTRLESLGRVCGGLAHDFNNLLTVMRFHGEAIDDPEIRSEFLQAQEEAANLTAGMLTFARDRTLREQEVEVASFLSEAKPLIERPLPPDVRCQWTNTCDDAVIKLDPAQLQQVLMNLVTNACHAMPNGGDIAITADFVELSPKESLQMEMEASHVVRITVSDTGIGMNTETQSRATEPFFTTKPRGKGTGLGLSTVHGAVRDAGGTLQILSEPGQGTTISILLPLHKTLANPTRPYIDSEPAETPDTATKRNVVLVEDRESVAHAVRTILRSADYHVSLFPDAETAWLELQNGMPVDYLISDVILPGMSGIELVRKAVERFPAVKAILTSGHQDNDLSIVTENPETIRFLPKPFGSTELLDAMSAIRRADGAEMLPARPHLQGETSKSPV